jgi:hypothetical protein
VWNLDADHLLFVVEGDAVTLFLFVKGTFLQQIVPNITQDLEATMIDHDGKS